ncbi:NAD(P)-binding protein [Exidia glandulosa HHB12029]|uniref:NAD(P)-binding protein n=1 Tax=Exidia glandulosa HHB12029 TaxID=1314781 RepID=A0A165I1K3_EXIGL|nr:NAD(P)-binding protein [Exidia glandulosa HHB12029]
MAAAATQKTVLITGCTPGGIGHALAVEFHEQGFRVFATARRVKILEDLHDKGIDVLALDVADDVSVKTAAERVAEVTNGRLDVLVNNAGQEYNMAATDLDISRAQSLFNTNLFGVMRMVREFAPLLVKAKGKILNVGSVAGLIPVPFRSVYGASKAALHSYGDSLRLEMKPFDVTVITLVTGGVGSEAASKPRPNEGIITPKSLYWPAADVISGMFSDQSEGTMPVHEYAKQIVALAQGTQNVPWFWAGSYASTMWFMTTFLSKRALEGVTGRFIKGMGEVDALVRGTKSP